MSAPAPIISNFRLLEKNTLKSFFDVELASGMILSGCALHELHGKHWIGLPARPYSKPDGEQSWVKIVDFKDKATGARFPANDNPARRRGL